MRAKTSKQCFPALQKSIYAHITTIFGNDYSLGLCFIFSLFFLGQQKKCPICNHLLGSKLDIVRIDLNPSEAYKSMVLCGLHPDIIMDICSRSINFWLFQNRQDYMMKVENFF